jgi:hypothetical protein
VLAFFWHLWFAFFFAMCFALAFFPFWFAHFFCITWRVFSRLQVPRTSSQGASTNVETNLKTTRGGPPAA